MISLLHTSDARICTVKQVPISVGPYPLRSTASTQRVPSTEIDYFTRKYARLDNSDLDFDNCESSADHRESKIRYSELPRSRNRVAFRLAWSAENFSFVEINRILRVRKSPDLLHVLPGRRAQATSRFLRYFNLFDIEALTIYRFETLWVLSMSNLFTRSSVADD